MRHLRDRAADLEQAGMTIYAISLDHPWSQRAWAESLSIDTIRFLSDRLGEAAEAFGVLTAYNEMPMAAHSVFLLEGDTVRASWMLTSRPPLPDVDAIVAAASSP